MRCFGKEYGEINGCVICKVKKSCYREMKVKPSNVLPSGVFVKIEDKKKINYVKCIKKPERIMKKEDK